MDVRWFLAIWYPLFLKINRNLKLLNNFVEKVTHKLYYPNIPEYKELCRIQ